jgi:hypothetical protein
MNTIQMTGRLTKAIRQGNSENVPVVNFTVAVELGMQWQPVEFNGREILALVPTTSYLVCAAWGADVIAASTLEAGQEVAFTIRSLRAKGREYQGRLLADVVARVSDVCPGAKRRAKAPDSSFAASLA